MEHRVLFACAGKQSARCELPLVIKAFGLKTCKLTMENERFILPSLQTFLQFMIVKIQTSKKAKNV